MSLYAFEGGNGVGKTTVINAVAQRLRNKLGDDKVVVLTNPSSGPIGQEARRFMAEFKQRGLPPFFSQRYETVHFARTLAMLFTADRQVIQPVIHEHIDADKTVLVDRYSLSTLIYQCAMIGDVHMDGDLARWIKEGHHGVLDADRTFILDAPMEVTRARLAARGERLDDRVMADIEPAVRQMYREAEDFGFSEIGGVATIHRINASRPIHEVVDAVVRWIEKPLF
jgi:dTMP kinase